MKDLLKHLFGRYSRTLRLLLVYSGMLLMVGCSSPLDLLTGGGPNIAANVQAGKTNTQTLGQTKVTEQSIVRPQARDIKQTSDTNKVSADSVQTVVVNELPIWLVALFIVLFALWSLLLYKLPSPDQIWKKRK